MKIKYPFKYYIKNYLIYYLLSLFLVPIFCTYLIRVKTQPKDYQKYSFFIGATLKDQSGFKKYINDILVDDLEIRTYCAGENESVFGQLLSANGKMSDIIILSKTKADTLTVSALTDLTSYTNLPLDNAYEVEGKKYGINLKKDDQLILSNYINYLDDDYYIFINPSSVHTLDILEKGKTNQTYTLLKEIYHI